VDIEENLKDSISDENSSTPYDSVELLNLIDKLLLLSKLTLKELEVLKLRFGLG
jgi:DNA-directed RNA polymerase sigma subunit (sigma70/sigma32)